MNKRLTYIDPLQLGKVLAVLYGLFSLVFVPFFLLIMFIGAHAGAQNQNNALPFGGMMAGGLFMVVLAPVMYAFMGFIGGLIAAVIYNLVAGWTGGIRFTLTDDAPQLP